MDFMHQGQVAFYKKLEEDWNKKFHDLCNTSSFVQAYAKEVHHHLNQVIVHRRLITEWLTYLDIPNKNEVAEFANRKIDCEAKLDFLEDTAYWVNRAHKMNVIHFVEMKEALEELLSVIEEEICDEPKGNLESLEKELWDLKFYFHTQT